MPSLPSILAAMFVFLNRSDASGEEAADVAMRIFALARDIDCALWPERWTSEDMEVS
jgi:hypothetical protein